MTRTPPRVVHSKHATFCPDCLAIKLEPTGYALGISPSLVGLRCLECKAEFYPEWNGLADFEPETDCYAQPH